MPTERGSRKFLTWSFPAATGSGMLVCTFAGTIASIMVAVNVKPTTATLAITKNGASALITSGATIDLNAPTVYAGSAIALATAGPSLHVAVGDTLLLVATITTAGSYTAGSVTIGIDPDLL